MMNTTAEHPMQQHQRTQHPNAGTIVPSSSLSSCIDELIPMLTSSSSRCHLRSPMKGSRSSISPTTKTAATTTGAVQSSSSNNHQTKWMPTATSMKLPLLDYRRTTYNNSHDSIHNDNINCLCSNNHKITVNSDSDNHGCDNDGDNHKNVIRMNHHQHNYICFVQLLLLVLASIMVLMKLIISRDSSRTVGTFNDTFLILQQQQQLTPQKSLSVSQSSSSNVSNATLSAAELPNVTIKTATAAIVIYNNAIRRDEIQENHSDSEEGKSNTSSSFSIDDYYTRNHTLYQEEESSDNNNNYYNNRNQMPILIIGGTDGSGTRSIVDVLQNELGVQMIYEDSIGLDVHGSMLYNGLGWPTLVDMIFNYTHSANFDIKSIPEKELGDAIWELSKLKLHLSRVAEGKRNNYIKEWKLKNKNGIATGVLYGFKAPVTMLLLPLLLELYDNVKFIHVVRDGRDIALSSNQSPVAKFYDSFYGGSSGTEGDDGNATLRRELAVNITASDNSTIDHRSILAMELWNDWNVQAHEFAQNHVGTTIAKNYIRKTFDYITIRTDDLIQSEDTRFATITKLASFVGSQRSIESICQYSHSEPIHDQGMSQSTDDTPTTTATQRRDVEGNQEESRQDDKIGSDVQSRYGKWKKRLQNEPIVSQMLHERGAEALRIFGYEPYQSILHSEFHNQNQNNRMMNQLLSISSSLSSFCEVKQPKQ